MNSSQWLVLVLAVILANVPFLTSRFLFFLKPPHKSFVLELFEFLVYFIVMGLISHVLESKTGNAHTQELSFYVVVFCVFVCLAFPGFVYRYFWKNGSFRKSI